MKKISSIFILPFIIFIIGCSTSNYYLVRHAEKTDNSKNPPLSEDGKKRADVLKNILKTENIDQLYATDYLRTQNTVKPLANSLNKVVTTYDARKTYDFVEKLKKLNNKNVIVAGHSNTVPDMVLLFTGDSVHIGHDDYCNLYLIKKQKKIFKETYQLEKRTYGKCE